MGYEDHQSEYFVKPHAAGMPQTTDNKSLKVNLLNQVLSTWCRTVNHTKQSQTNLACPRTTIFGKRVNKKHHYTKIRRRTHYRQPTTKMDIQQTRPKTMEDDENTQPNTDHEYDTHHEDETQLEHKKKKLTRHQPRIHRNPTRLHYRTDTGQEENPTTLKPNIDLEHEEQPEHTTRTTRQKTRRNYRDNARVRPTTPKEQNRENPSKEKRSDANKTKIVLLENTIKQMRKKPATINKTREAEISAWQETNKYEQKLQEKKETK